MSSNAFFTGAAGRLLAALTVLIAVIASTPAQAQSASPPPRVGVCSPGLGIGLLEVPTERRDDPRAQTAISDALAPGASFTRRVQVCNGTPAPVTAQLYGGAASISDGSFQVEDGRTPNELSSYLRITPPTLSLPSGEVGVATVTIALPADASGGEQYAAIWAEVPPPAGGSGVGVASRVGLRVYLDVNGGAERSSDFVIESLQASRSPEGDPLVLASVRNTGQRALDLRGELRLSDGPAGLSAGPFAATLGTTLGPGDASPVRIVLDRAIDGGPWLATLSVTSGTLERRAQATLTFPDQAGASAAPVEAVELSLVEDPKVIIPFAIGLISLLLLVLLVLAYLTSRRRAREKRAG